ncbi:unnamed protein product [Symbiodinium sp. CCMP2592]|nr:unnamed protein product [Symbiodinium sp. CCMP2592]
MPSDVQTVLLLVWGFYWPHHRHFVEDMEPLLSTGWHGYQLYEQWADVIYRLVMLNFLEADVLMRARIQLQRAGRLYASRYAVRLRDQCRIAAQVLDRDPDDRLEGFQWLCEGSNPRLNESFLHASRVSAAASFVIERGASGRLQAGEDALYDRVMQETERLRTDDDMDPFDDINFRF